MDIKNLSIIRQSFANTVFTHKVQEVAVERHEKKAFCVKIWNIIFVSVVLILLVLQIKYPQNQFLSSFGIGLTVAEVIFLIVQLQFNFEQKAVTHKNSALKLMGLRDCYGSLIADLMNESVAGDTLIARRDSLQKEYQLICELAPQTSTDDYTEAQIKLNKRGAVSGEEFTWSDEEIDWFLPENLRLNK